MTMRPKTLTDRTHTVLVGSPPEVFSIDREHPNFELAARAVDNAEVTDDELLYLFEPARAAEACIGNSELVEVVDGVLRFDGHEVHDHLSSRMLDAWYSGFELSSWEAFAKNVYENPSENAREELYGWLEASDLPLTSDGHFLAYKYVTDDFMDCHTRTFDNSVGSVVEMPRGMCDTDKTVSCSTGLHFCSLSYLPNTPSNVKIVLVKVNPKDVTSFPTDHSAKGRCCRYEVVADVSDRYTELLFDPVVNDYDDYDDEDDFEDDLSDWEESTMKIWDDTENDIKVTSSWASIWSKLKVLSSGEGS